TFDRLRTRLREELGATPAADLLATHRRLLGAVAFGGAEPAAPAPLPDPVVASGPLVGRSEQLAELRQRWRQALAGRMSVVLLRGEAGIGKTRLCAELATLVSRQGAAVLYGRCDEEAVAPFQPFVEALAHHIAHADGRVLARQLDGGGGELAQLLPQLRGALPDLPPPLGGQPRTDRYRLFEEAAALVRGLSRERPVLVVLDDLHWADAATMAMLRQVLRGWRSSRILALATYRPTELEPERPLGRLIADLPREGPAQRADLGGLDRQEVTRLIAQVARREPPEEFARKLHEETAGNPFFVREVLRHLLERGILDPEHGGWPGGGNDRRAGIPESVAATIRRRLDRLAPPTNLVLRHAAVVGREFPAEVLALVCGGELDLPRALDEAEAAGVIAPRAEPAGAYAFSHALVHAAIYDSLGAAERGATHRRVGEAYEALPGAGAGHEPELARHFRLAVGPGAAEKAIEHSVRAGRQAFGRLAYEEAVEHLGLAATALERGGGDGEELAEVLVELGRAQNRAGGSTLAKQTFERAADLASASGRPDLLRRAALGYAGPWLELGTVEPKRLGLLERALEAVGPQDSSDRAALLARLALEVYYSGPERRERLSREAVEVARRLGDPNALARTLMSRRVAISGSSDLEQRLAVSTELVDLARRSGAHQMELWGRVWRAADHLERADVDAAYREFEEYSELARRLRQPAFLWQPPLFAAMRALYEGRLEEIEGLMAEGLAIGARAHDPNAANYFGILGFMLRREQARQEEVEDAVGEFVARYPAVPAWRCGLLLLQAELGHEERAWSELERLAAGGFDDLPRDINWLPAMAWLALAVGRL
ncbi:MAG TPA: AAA family ATPase, partial [Solirubrobacterales bacterium]|nr:AAA family ATPase [Solirubrobacterales bacterium]